MRRVCHQSLIALVVAAGPAAAAEPPVTAVAFAPDGKSLVACSQAGVRCYSWPGLKPTRSIKAPAPNLHGLAFSPGGDRLAVAGGAPGEDGTVTILSWPAAEPVKALRGHDDSVRAVAWRDNTTMASAGLDRRVILWDATAGKRLRTLAGHSGGVTSLCFLAGGKTLVSAGVDQSLRVWDADTGRLIRSMTQHTRPVHGVAPRPRAAGLPMVASAADDRTLRFWQPTIGRMVRFVKLGTVPLDVAWLADGSRAAVSCADGRVRLIDPVEAKVTRELPGVEGWAYALAVRPSGGVVVGGVGGLSRILCQ